MSLAQSSSSLTLAGKVALVTGASRGIGAAIAKELASLGRFRSCTMPSLVFFRFQIGYSGSEEKANQVASAINATAPVGVRAAIFKADLTNPKSAGDQVRAVHQHFGRIDILVNNAAIYNDGATDEGYTNIWNVNVHAPWEAVKAVADLIADGGRIVTIGSGMSRGAGMQGVYAANKAAIENYTRAWARQFGPRKITANVVSPGHTNTEMNPADGEFAAARKATIPLGEYADPSDIAKAVAFLSTSAANFVTGSVLPVDGGVLA